MTNKHKDVDLNALINDIGKNWTSEDDERIRKSTRAAKLSLAYTGRKLPEETKKKMSLTRTGIKQKPEHIEKIRLTKIGKKFSEEAKANMSMAAKLSIANKTKNIGQKHSEETKAKMRLAAIGRKKPTKEQIEKHRKAMIGRKNSPETIAKRVATRAANKLKKQQELLNSQKG